MTFTEQDTFALYAELRTKGEDPESTRLRLRHHLTGDEAGRYETRYQQARKQQGAAA